MSHLTRKMSCKIKEKNRMSFERNCGKQSWYRMFLGFLRCGGTAKNRATSL